MLVGFATIARRNCGKALSCPIRAWKQHPSSERKTRLPSSSRWSCHRLEPPTQPERAADLSGPPKQPLATEPSALVSKMMQNIHNWELSPAHGRWEGTAYHRLWEGRHRPRLSLIVYSRRKDPCREPMAEGIVGARALLEEPYRWWTGRPFQSSDSNVCLVKFQSQSTAQAIVGNRVFKPWPLTHLRLFHFNHSVACINFN
jgi:hypothetical protein